MRLHRHLGKGRVIEEPRQAVGERFVGAEDRPLADAIRREGTGERLEVAVDGVLAVHQGLAPPDRTPEVVDVVGVRARLLVEGEGLRLGPDEHGDGAGALRRLAGRAERVARDVGGDDQGAPRPPAAGAYPVRRRHEPRSPGVAGVLQLVDAAAATDSEQLVHEDRDRLGVVDAGLGGDEEHADRLRVDVRRAEQPRAGTRRHGDDVLARRRDRHLLDPEPLRHLLGWDAPRARQRGERQRVGRDVDREALDTHRHEAPRAASRARYWPSAIRGK